MSSSDRVLGFYSNSTLVCNLKILPASEEMLKQEKFDSMRLGPRCLLDNGRDTTAHVLDLLPISTIQVWFVSVSPDTPAILAIDLGWSTITLFSQLTELKLINCF